MPHLGPHGALHVVCGCMFAGKTTEAIKTIHRWKSVGVPVMPISHALDTRFCIEGIKTHDLVQSASWNVNTLMELISTPDFDVTRVVVVEEAQFFPDLIEFCKTAVDLHHKTVYVYGLDGNYKREPFGDVSKLCALADSFKKINALCKYCQDGTEAPFTCCIEAMPSSGVLIGGSEMYVAVCRSHYLKFHKSDVAMK